MQAPDPTFDTTAGVVDVEAEFDKLLNEPDNILDSLLPMPEPEGSPLSAHWLADSPESSDMSSAATAVVEPSNKKRRNTEESTSPSSSVSGDLLAEDRKRRNRESAARSRTNKQQYLHGLEETTSQLRQENESLKREKDVLAAENSMLKQQIEFFKNLFGGQQQPCFPASFYPTTGGDRKAGQPALLAVVFAVGFFLVPSEWNLAQTDDVVRVGSGRMLLGAADEAPVWTSLTPRTWFMTAYAILVMCLALRHTVSRLATKETKSQ